MPTGRLFDGEFLAQLERLRAMARQGRGRSAAAGRHVAGGAGSSLDFADHRSYSPGDDLRYLDWNYLARMDRPIVRLFHRHAARRISILIDTSASMGLGEKFTFARRLAAGITVLAISAFDHVRLMPFSDRLGSAIQISPGRYRLDAILEFLQQFAPQGQTDLLAAAKQYPPAGETEKLLVISDLLQAQELDQAVAAFKARAKEVRVLHVVDAADADPQLQGELLLQEVESGHRLSIGESPAVVDAYRQQWQAFCQAVISACRAKGAEFHPVYTQSSWVGAALSALE
jgi:uncharacterized protein (DUF58 family)